MQQTFLDFYNQRGVRRVAMLQAPTPWELKQFPRASVLHYVQPDSTVLLDANAGYFSGYTNRIQVDYPLELADPETAPRKGVVNLVNTIRQFHLDNKKFQYHKDAIQTVSDVQQLCVLNYNIMAGNYRYTTTPIVAYVKWKNLYKTVLTNVNIAAGASTRVHFLELDIPDLVPSVVMLNSYVDKPMSQSIMRIMNSPAKWWLMEIWKWINPELRQQSIFSVLDQNHYTKLTLLFKTADGLYVPINLGYLDSWIKGQPNNTPNKANQQIKFEMLQKLFLFFEMTLKKNVQETETVEENPQSSPSSSQDPDHNETDSLSHDSEPETHEDANPDDEVESDIPVSMAVKNGAQDLSAPKSIAEIEASDSFVSSSTDFVKQLSDMEEDLKSLDLINRKKLEEAGLKVDGSEIESDEQQTIADDVTQEQLADLIYKDHGVQASLEHEIVRAAEVGILTVQDMRKMQKFVQAQPMSKDPYGSNRTIAQMTTITEEELRVDKDKSIIVTSDLVSDPSMKESTLQSYDADYINKNMRKDVVSCVMGLQKAGVIIRKHTIEENHTVMGSFEVHTIEIKPVDGQPSTVRMKLPIVDDEGTFVANSSKYSLRKQRIDKPIRKIGPHEVGLTSYYGKVGISRATKKSNSSLEYVLKQINGASVSDNPVIKDVAPAFVYDNNFPAPYIYSGLAGSFKSFTAAGVHLVFDHTEREKMVTPEQLKALEKDGRRLTGTVPGGFVVVDNSDHFFKITKDGETALGDIFDILKLNRLGAPVDYAEVKVFSNSIPVGVVLGYTLGFTRLIKFLGARFRTVEGRKQKNMEPYEYSITFQDKSYIFDRRDKVASLVLAGYGFFEKTIKSRPSTDFDHKAVYVELLESKGMGSIYIRELELREQLFVDPITKGVLESLREPVTLRGLLVRSCELLCTYSHPDSQDFDSQRIRGYERFAGAIYKCLSKSIKQFRNKNISNRSKVDLSPYEVWNTVLKDPAVKIVEDINPIQNVKGTEIVTYVGEGGRAKESMNKASRAFHVSDIGVTSEATVDSGDVGINLYLSTNPQIMSQRGVKNPDAVLAPGTMLSVSAMISPSCDRDDPRRVAFVTHQSAHTVAAVGYEQSRFRTGYEYVIGHRTGSMFCATAKQDGKVVSVDDAGVIVEYKDGTKKGFAVGRQYGKAEGSTYPHDIVAAVKVGQSIKKGDTLTYNTGFFEPDKLDPKSVVYKGALTAKTVFYETAQTLEDSSAISAAFGRRLATSTTKIKSYTIDFKQNLRNMVKVGQRVDPNTILMLIEDEITASTTAFDEKSLELLASLSKSAPRAGYLGVVDKIEVFYHGDKLDMSPTLKAIADASDRKLSAERRSIGQAGVSGAVTDDYRVEGTPLTLDKAEVRVYITVGNGMSNGDKLVFFNQLKSTIGEVMDYKMITENGEEIEAIFGFRSNAARIVSSAMEMGTTITLLKVLDQLAIKAYDS